jgi:N-acyl-D-amino-acid deacylase
MRRWRLRPAGAIYFSMDEADVQRILAFGPTMIGSDGLPHDAAPHPRLWGDLSARAGALQPGPRAVPAGDRGAQDDRADREELSGSRDAALLKPGAFADITLFDPRTVDETATFAHPIRPARGIDTVIVNGTIAWRDGKTTGARTGRVLRRH